LSSGGSSGRALVGIDEGTTAVKAGLFDEDLRELASARRETPVSHPAPGLVEQDPEAILTAVEEVVAEVLAQAGDHEVIAAGLAHQGESVLAWDASGQPLSEVIVWQDKRQQALLEEIDAGAVERSGLPLDPYFSAGKLAWLLRNSAPVSLAAEQGSLHLGTVDAYLVQRLGGRFATDLSTASRTQLLALGRTDWDEELLQTFGVKREWLPRLGPTVGALGELRSERWCQRLPLAAQLVDQQAALAGSGAVRPGEVKATYGTGVFVLGRTDGPVRASGLLPTVAWALGDASGTIEAVSYALDGGVFAAGSLLDWLSGSLGLARDTRALTALAASVDDSAGVKVLPALAGLGAPWWRADARAVLAGLHAGVRPAHVARAALEAIAARVADIVEAMSAVVSVESVRVDGGLTNSDELLRVQADALGLRLEVGVADATALGAAMLAGVGAGLFASVEDAASRLPPSRTIEPRTTEAERLRERERWRAFVHASAAL
jgi:glycerol kinase